MFCVVNKFCSVFYPPYTPNRPPHPPTHTHTHTHARTHTHTHTGSIYCDNSLRIGGMNGEGVRSGAVIGVKTHKSIPVTWTEEHVPKMASNDPKGKV